MNVLAKDFNIKEIFSYVFPTLCMMVFMSTYTLVDGLFVANYVGEDALSATNIVWPSINIIFALGLMFSTGGTAVMGRLMGEGKDEEARSFLSLLYILVIILGLILSSLYFFGSEYLIKLLGANEQLFTYANDYIRALGILGTGFFLQIFTQSFFILAGKPILGFIICFSGGITNILLDYIFISPNMMDLGITGAGLATGLGNMVPGIFGICYFLLNRDGSLYFVTPTLHMKYLLQSMFNGMSELVSQSSTAITTFIFNIILLNIAGESGVASITVILYMQMFQTALYFGYSIGVAPIISYKYGARDHKGLEKVLHHSLKIIMTMSIIVIALSYVFGEQAVSIFISKDSDTFYMALNGLKLYSLAYLFMGLNIFISSAFTALSDGKTSALLSLSRTLVFLIPIMIGLPILLGINGVWLAVPLAELGSVILAWYFYKKI